MGWLNNIFRGDGNSQTPAVETISSTNASSAHRSLVLRHARIRHTVSIISAALKRILTQKRMVQEDNREGMEDEEEYPEGETMVEERDSVAFVTPTKSFDSASTLDDKVRSYSLSAIKEAEALQFEATQFLSDTTSSPNSEPHPLNASQHADTEQCMSTMSTRSRVFSISSAMKSSTTISSASQIPKRTASLLTLPAATMSTDSFKVDVDCTKFENVKIDLPRKHAPAPMFIKNHDVILIIDDGAGIDRQSWDSIYDIINGVTKRLCPLTALGDRLGDTLLRDIPERDATISLRFINNHHHIARVKNLKQIRNVFNWVNPRTPTRTGSQCPPNVETAPPHTSPLRVLEFHFRKIYNERLRDKQWVGQMPTTIVLFISSQVSPQLEDMHLFIAECAEKLNAEQIPLPLISILVVQCNAEPVLYRQLVETRRMISWKNYTPKRKYSETAAPVGRRNSKRRSKSFESKRRPQRDWVDIITVKDWERAGGLTALTGMIEMEIRQGTQRRRELYKESVKNHLSSPSENCSIHTLTEEYCVESNYDGSASAIGHRLPSYNGAICAAGGMSSCD